MGEKMLSTSAKISLSEDDVRFLWNELRKSSIIWDGRKEILRLSRRKVLVRRAKNGNPVFKFQWQCAVCKKWFRNATDMEVDHIKEIGGVTSFTGDWNEVIAKMFPRPVADHLQALCLACHARKTARYNNARLKWTRK